MQSFSSAPTTATSYRSSLSFINSLCPLYKAAVRHCEQYCLLQGHSFVAISQMFYSPTAALDIGGAACHFNFAIRTLSVTLTTNGYTKKQKSIRHRPSCVKACVKYECWCGSHRFSPPTTLVCPNRKEGRCTRVERILRFRSYLCTECKEYLKMRATSTQVHQSFLR